ncbi:hypothetical protein [Chitinophaga varians]|uniref:hypothetical protein n=1 Tax=Chitinophaga varians TaxID=2202339 RepID=UPI00165F10EA|nr:hypothetical protein [Chitinophaga varians]MBC9914460.1 hypothetical protein [Chitinophaga varians]
MEKKKRTTLKNVLKGILALVLVIIFLTIHTLQWVICGFTFISFIFPLALFLFAGIPLAWWAARKCRKWLTRFFDGNDVTSFHVLIMLVLLSWIPPALLLSTNFFFPVGAAVKETLPVVKQGTSRDDSGFYYWVKIEKHGLRKRIVEKEDLVTPPVDSVIMDIRKGYLGFEFFEHPDFIQRSAKK